MPKRIAPLTDTKVRTAKPTKKAQKIIDTQETETFEVIAREWHAKFAPSLGRKSCHQNNPAFRTLCLPLDWI